MLLCGEKGKQWPSLRVADLGVGQGATCRHLVQKIQEGIVDETIMACWPRRRLSRSWAPRSPNLAWLPHSLGVIYTQVESRRGARRPPAPQKAAGGSLALLVPAPQCGDVIESLRLLLVAEHSGNRPDPTGILRVLVVWLSKFVRACVICLGFTKGDG